MSSIALSVVTHRLGRILLASAAIGLLAALWVGSVTGPRECPSADALSPDAPVEQAAEPVDVSPCHAGLWGEDEIPPDEVTRHQVLALQHNDELSDDVGDDAGIRFAWGLASPANQAATGPFSRFARMVKAGYAPLLEAETASFTPAVVRGARATVHVRVADADGTATAYRWHLSRLLVDSGRAQWRTDAVVEVDEAHFHTVLANAR